MPQKDAGTKQSLLDSAEDVDDVFEYRRVSTKEQLLKFDGLIVGMLTLAELPPGKEDFYCAYCINTLYDDEDNAGEGAAGDDGDIEKGDGKGNGATEKEREEKDTKGKVANEKTKKDDSKKREMTEADRAKYGVLWDFTQDVPYCRGSLEPQEEEGDVESARPVGKTYHIFHSECLAQQIKFWNKQRGRSQRINIRCPNGCRSLTLDPPYYLHGNGSDAGSDNGGSDDGDDDYQYCSAWRLASFCLRAFACLLTAFLIWYYGWAERNMAG